MQSVKTGNLALFYGRPMALRPNFTAGLPFSEIKKLSITLIGYEMINYIFLKIDMP